ncbi:MAG: site-specific integrase [Chloroflexota bacterium]|nr:site-specific integrase [Chloroflexota bacterium]
MATTRETGEAGGRKRRKRPAGDGSITFDAKRGLWVGSLMVGYRPDGKPDRRKVKSKSQAECRRKLDELKGRAAGGLLCDADKGRETVATLLDAWLASVKPDLRAGTYRNYELYTRVHFKPAFGRHRLSTLRPATIQQFLAARREALRAQPNAEGEKPLLSARTVRHLYVVLNTAFRWGVRKGLLAVNPCDRVDPPRVEHHEAKALTPEETARLLAAAAENTDPLRALWELAALTGARKGELLAIRWADLDLDAGTLQIRRTQTGTKGGAGIYNPPKTTRSRRVLELAPDVVAALRAHRDRQSWDRQRLGTDYADADLVFATSLGTPLDQGNVTRAFKRALSAAGLPRTTNFHRLRHGAATMMLEAGETVATVSEYLGHSSPAVTMAIYAHTVPGAKRRAAERLAETIRNARTG